MIKIKDGEVRPGVYGPCSDIPPNWDDIRTKFGYTTLPEIAGDEFIIFKHKNRVVSLLNVVRYIVV